MSNPESPDGTARFVVCIRNDEYPVSLEPRKIYQVIADPDAAAHGHIRVIDESGDDYLYPAEYFLEVELPRSVGEALLQAL
jgi:hypothetical protein